MLAIKRSIADGGCVLPKQMFAYDAVLDQWRLTDEALAHTQPRQTAGADSADRLRRRPGAERSDAERPHATSVGT